MCNISVDHANRNIGVQATIFYGVITSTVPKAFVPILRDHVLFRKEWRLHPWVFAQIWERFGRADVDLYASRENVQCSLLFLMRDPSAPFGMEALVHQWLWTLLYAFPPVVLIQPMFERVRRKGLSLILVSPRWSRQPWFEEIVCPLGRDSWQLLLRSDLLSHAHGFGMQGWRLGSYVPGP